jgi:hypothetical protein
LFDGKETDMTTRRLFLFALLLLAGSTAATADILRFKDGKKAEAVVTRVEDGKVFARIGSEAKAFDLSNIRSVDLNTLPRLATVADLPIDQFLQTLDAEELDRNAKQLEKAEAEIHAMLDRIRAARARKPVVSERDLSAWEAAKEELRKPLIRYQELLNEIYSSVLAEVNSNCEITREVNKVFVGAIDTRTSSGSNSHCVTLDELWP